MSKPATEADELPEAALAELPEQRPTNGKHGKEQAVADLTMSAYQKASLLQLTKEEAAALQAEFPDDAFRPGAAGKDNLLYIEHAFLRDRLNEVLGLGQWAIIPRNRWAESFVTQKNVAGSRVYIEAMLIVRGAFVAEAVGDMDYYPSNASQNYGDAAEGAKTAAFRRCCKEFGIGLQAWKKEWCAGWWQRNRDCITRFDAEELERLLRVGKVPLDKFYGWVCEFEHRAMPEELGYGDLRKIFKTSMPKILEYLKRREQAPKEAKA